MPSNENPQSLQEKIKKILATVKPAFTSVLSFVSTRKKEARPPVVSVPIYSNEPVPVSTILPQAEVDLGTSTNPSNNALPTGPSSGILQRPSPASQPPVTHPGFYSSSNPNPNQGPSPVPENNAIPTLIPQPNIFSVQSLEEISNIEKMVPGARNLTKEELGRIRIESLTSRN